MRIVSAHFPDFGQSRRLDLPNGDYIVISDEAEPLRYPLVGQITATALTPPFDSTSAVVIPLGSGWRIMLG